MNLEDKFIEMLLRIKAPYIMYLQSKDGFIKLEYREKWDDGLGSRTLIRIINPKMGLSTAPISWEHLLKSLKINNVTEKEFHRALDRRIDMQILYYHRSLVELKGVFGEEYIEDVIENKGKRSFTDDISELFNSLIGKQKPKLELTVIKGGADE